MPSPQMHIGGGDAPDLVTHEGWTYVVDKWTCSVSPTEGRIWRVIAWCRARDLARLTDWMIAEFFDDGSPRGAWVRLHGAAAWDLWNRRD